jgi:hypothetical protein
MVFDALMAAAVVMVPSLSVRLIAPPQSACEKSSIWTSR